jgi:TetR/AcrR family transcriptional repressor of nem operon
VTLHRRFHDALFDEVKSVIGETMPGKGRLAAAARTYLDGCLRDRGVKALLLEARDICRSPRRSPGATG